jgi:hypothetical protein
MLLYIICNNIFAYIHMLRGSPASAKPTLEDTAHTANHSPKVVSFVNYPLLSHSNSQTKIRVFSNPKLTSSGQKASSKAIDWMKLKVGIEETPAKRGKGQLGRGYLLSLVSGLPTSRKCIEEFK